MDLLMQEEYAKADSAALRTLVDTNTAIDKANGTIRQVEASNDSKWFQGHTQDFEIKDGNSGGSSGLMAGNCKL